MAVYSVFELDVGDFDFGERLAMPRVPAIPGAAGEAIDLDLGPFAVAHHLGRHLRAFEHRLPSVHLLAIARQQDSVERDLGPRLGGEERDLDRDSWLGAELRATGGKDRVGHWAGPLIGAYGSVKPPRKARSHLAPRASPSSGTRPAASSGRRAPRARGRSASRAVAGSWAPALRGTEPHRGADAQPAGAPCGLPRPA